ncbi:Acetyl esterase/lipase [Prosthecobacter debontii]|uniref:Acetyl esterase/lipase n=1 Tax=Prosthecobacter debontii TaxID=48467 RepID=A0A1T4XM28_9BACT|nr:alpha/beta hydrolase [Prosthecobacter debontii]SKA90612.1 Acetyl esterase/lipase [Prosthecobacter debontii]
MKVRLTSLLLTIISLTAQGQQAPSPEERAKRLFDLSDRNRDDKLTREELPERLRPNFDRVDANKDGFISRAEHLAVMSRQTPSRPSPENARRPLLEGIEAKLDLPYADTENPRQRLDLYLPKLRKTDKPLPVVVFIHGGGWRNGDKATGANNVGRYVTSGEYAGVSIGYRLTGEARWPAQIHDCKAAIRWIKAHAQEYNLNPEKIGVWGSSAGGHLVSMLGTSGDVKELEGTLGKHLDQNSKVACVANYYGPENFLTMIRQPSQIDRTKGAEYPEALLLGGAVPEREETAREASPVTHVSAGDAPFFTAHGTEDPLVPFAQGEEVHEALKKAGVPSILQQMTHGGHGFRSELLDQRLKQFFDKYLRGIESEIDSSPITVETRQKK